MRRSAPFLLAGVLACSKPPPPPPPAEVAAPSGPTRITFESTPPGAKVLLDGAALPDATPFTLPMDANGKHHTARFVLDDHEPSEQDFMVPVSAYTVSASLPAAPKVKFVSEPPGAQVKLDGAVRVAATPGEVGVASGEHELELSLNGYVPVKRKLGAKERGEVSTRLKPAAALDVDADQPGAHVLVDGVDTGAVTPAKGLLVAANAAHTVSVRAGNLGSDPEKVKALKPGTSKALAFKVIDVDKKTLLLRQKRLQKELSHLEAERDRYDRKTSAFQVSNARAEMKDEQHLKDVEDEIEQLQNQLADLQDQLDK